MRIAVAGTHRTGKTTLIEALAEQLPGHEVIEEPYRALEDEGYEFSDPPAAEDFERQLRHALATLEDAPANALLDRCPLDFVAYLMAMDEDFDLDDWREPIAAAMAELDLVVVVSIEAPDRIAVPAHEDRRLRARVDEAVRGLLLDDTHGFGAEAIEVSGAVADRVRQVLRAIGRGAPR